MKKNLIHGLLSLSLPFTAYAGGYTRNGGYQTSGRKQWEVAELPLLQDEFVPFAQLDPATRPLPTMVADNVRELLVIDSAVPDKQTLLADLRPGIDVVELAAHRSGIKQLQAVLKRYRHLDAVHIVSHARAGELLLGTSTLNQDFIARHDGIAQALRQAVKPGGDVLLYGCDLAQGEKGKAFVAELQRETGLDIAASDDLTGNAAMGGDWDLEVIAGNIDVPARVFAHELPDYSAVLAPTIGTENFGTTYDLLVTDGNGPTTNVSGSGLSATFSGDTSSVDIYLFKMSDYFISLKCRTILSQSTIPPITAKARPGVAMQ